MNIRALPIFLLAASVTCQPGLSADIQFQGPLLGFYVDRSTAGLHAIAGVPGSAIMGPALATGLDAVWLAPDSRTALGLRGGMIFLLRDVRDTTNLLPLIQWDGPVDSVFWSSDSTGALLYSAARQVLHIAAGFPENPAVNRDIDVSGLGGPISSLRLSTNSLSPDSWTVAAVVRANGRAAPRLANVAKSLYFLTENGLPVLVRGISRPGAMDFTGDGRSLFVVEEKAAALMRVAVSAPDSIDTVNLNSVELVPSDIADLAVSRGGDRIFTVQKLGRATCGFQIATGNKVFCSNLDFSPNGIQRLSGSLYLLNPGGAETDPLWILDSDSGRTFFVPRGNQR